jgi:hypothetical protein
MECNDCDLDATDYGVTPEGTCPWCERPKLTERIEASD